MRIAKQSDWQTKPMPPKRSIVSLERRFSSDEIERIRAGLVPREMEDKWFVYWQDDTLFFHRSWTGFCVYIVRFVIDSDSYRMIDALVNRDSEQCSATNDAHDAKMISYLIDVLLLRQHADFPDDSEDPQKAVLRQWSQVGRAMLGKHPDDEPQRAASPHE